MTKEETKGGSVAEPNAAEGQRGPSGAAAKAASGSRAPNFAERKDRAGQYLEKLGSDFVFDEYQAEYLEREGLTELMKGVPIPLRHQDVVEFHGPKGLPLTRIAENMAQIIGINPRFAYAPRYIGYIRRYFNDKIVDVLTGEGKDEAEKGRFDLAAVHFRAALTLCPDDLHAMYGYAGVCRELYLAEEGGDDPGYVGQFKAESIEYFELCTELYPTFADAWYFLGYAYLNMGLYQKAKLAWKEFLKYTQNGEDRKEIQERLEQLEEPVKIENGCNHVMAGRWGEGIDILLPYRETQFEGWWPLHYYLGIAFARIGETDQAVGSFLRTLALSPSHDGAMEELIALYETRGELDLAEKYRKKLAIVREG